MDSCDVTYAYSVGHCLYVMFPFYWGALNPSPLTGCFFTARITRYLVLYLTYLYLITLLLYVNNYYSLLFRHPFPVIARLINLTAPRYVRNVFECWKGSLDVGSLLNLNKLKKVYNACLTIYKNYTNWEIKGCRSYTKVHETNVQSICQQHSGSLVTCTMNNTTQPCTTPPR